MQVCVQCRKEMKCSQNGVAIHYGHGHVYPGDEFTCPQCGNKVVVTLGNPIYEPQVNKWEHVIEMEQK